jgi:aarF domain-containing kinase
MILRDNFVHTDLHPGNIMVRPTVRGDDIQLVLLDYGLAEQLTPEVRRHFVGFLNCICAGDGTAAARHLLSWSSGSQECQDPDALRAGLEAFFAQHCRADGDEGINLDRVLKGILGLCRTYGVSIDSQYAALVTGTCVIVGLAAALDPHLNVADASAACLYAHALTGRLVGRLYS